MSDTSGNSFVSDYLNRQSDVYANQLLGGTTKPVAATNAKPVRPPEGEVGFLGKTIDFLSRPLYAVTNIADKALDLPSAFEEGTTAEALGNLVASPFTGFFAQSRENKNYFSDIIEKTVDVTNRNNPKYVDVKDNVDPLTKGGLGFAGDVALDPLTWIPAAWIAKGINVVASGVKATGRAAKAATGLGKTVEDLPDVKTPEGMRQGAQDVVDSSVRNPAQAADELASTIVSGEKMTPTVAKASAFRQLIDKKKFVKPGSKRPLKLAGQVSRELGKLIKQTVSVAGDIPVPNKFLDSPQWLAELENLPAEVRKSVAISPEFTKIGRYKIAEPNLEELLKTYDKAESSGTLTERNLSSVGEEINKIWNTYADAYDKNPNKVTILGDLAGETKQINSGLAGVNRILNLAKNEEDNLTAFIGTRMFGYLKGMGSTELASFVDKAQKVLSETGIVEDVLGAVSVNTAEWSLLRLFDINLPAYRAAQEGLVGRINMVRAGVKPTNLATDAKNLADDPAFVGFVDQIMAAAPGASGEVVTAASRGLLNMLVSNLSEKFLAKKYPLEKDGILFTGTEAGRTAKIKDTLGTYAQSQDLWGSVSVSLAKLFKGNPRVNAEGAIVKDIKGNYVYDAQADLPLIRTAREKAYLGFNLGEQKEFAHLSAMEAAEAHAIDRGLPLVIDYTTAGAARELRHFTTTDGYKLLKIGLEALGRARGVSEGGLRFERLKATLVFFNTADTAIAREKLFDAIMRVSQGAGRDEVLSIIKSNLNRTGKGEVPNWLATDSKGTFGFFPKTMPLPKTAGLTGEQKWVVNPKTGKNEFKGQWGKWDSNQVADDITDSLFAVRTEIDEVMQLRRQQFAGRVNAEYTTVAPEIARGVLRDMADPTAAASEIKKLNRMEDVVLDYFRQIDGTYPAAVITNGVIKGLVRGGFAQDAKMAEDTIEALVDGGDAVLGNNIKNAEKIVAREEEIIAGERMFVDEALNNPQVLSAEDAADLNYIKAENLAYPPELDGYSSVQIASESFNRGMRPNYGMTIRDGINLINDRKQVSFRMRKYWDTIQKEMAEIEAKFGGLVDGKTPILPKAFELIQNKRVGEPGSLLEEARKALLLHIGRVYDITGDFTNILLNSSFARAAAPLEQIQQVLAKHAVLGRGADNFAKLPESGQFIDMALAKATAEKYIPAAKKAIKSNDPAAIRRAAETMAALDQWRTWKPDDISHFIAASEAALNELVVKARFVDMTFARMKKYGLATANIKEAKALGFVKLEAGQGSYFEGLMPQNYYVAAEVAQSLKYVDLSLRQTKSLTSPMGKFIEKYADPALGLWKKIVTIFRPGHHIRNEIGGQTLRFSALGASGFMEAEYRIYKILAGRKSYDSVEMIKGLKDEGINVFNDADVAVSGTKFKVTANEAFQAMEDNLFDVGRTIEDLFADASPGAYQKTLDGLQTGLSFGIGKPGSAAEGAVLKVSEFVEHKARGAHFLQALQQLSDGKSINIGFTRVVKANNKEDAIRLAIEHTIFNHPNAASVTAFESRVMRRLFPFYSWYKPALVALTQAAVLHPARTLTLVPKANYNLAIAMGLNPDTMYNPFPSDQLFPSFLTEEAIGPQFKIDGKYISLQPGFAPQDVFGTLAGGPVEAATQMLNPYIRVPLELLAGSRLGTQAPIRDFSDYLDSSIPGVSYLSNVSGRSITGGFEPQDSVARGSKTSFDQGLSAFNWLTGLGARNYSRSSYVNYAEIENRNKAANESQSFVDRLLEK
tara:strand:+ start:19 stop:5256 length:5238 start_codon:yes stop_codon:yes gene_type:complete